MATEHPIPTDPRFQNLTGQKFGRLTVIAYAGKRRPRNHVWLCRCECGNERIVHGNSLGKGISRSCGCLRRDLLRVRKATHGHARRNGWTSTYRTWQGMLQRCCNPQNPGYAGYGGRGITVCDRWRHSFENFLADMGERPAGLSLDRIDNDAGYSRENCRWATRAEQTRNTRRTINLTFQGRTQCATDWAREIGISRATIRKRLRAGWSVEKALGTSAQHRSSRS